MEVISASTERIDRTEKLSAYRRITSRQEYVLAAQDEMAIEIHRRAGDGEWAIEVFVEPEEEIHLASADFS